MKYKWKKFSVPVNYSGDDLGGLINALIERTTRLMKYDLFSPSRFYFFIKDGCMDEFYRARNKWKQGLIGFTSVGEYRLFHKKMA